MQQCSHAPAHAIKAKVPPTSMLMFHALPAGEIPVGGNHHCTASPDPTHVVLMLTAGCCGARAARHHHIATSKLMT